MSKQETPQEFQDRVLQMVLDTQKRVFQAVKKRQGFDSASFDDVKSMLDSFARLYLDCHSILVGALTNHETGSCDIREPTWLIFSNQIAKARREEALERQKTDPQAVSIAATQCARLAFADFFEGEKNPEVIAKAELSLLINLAQDVVARTGNIGSVRIGVEMGIAVGVARLETEKAGSTVQ